jgi:hypothetical protein
MPNNAEGSAINQKLTGKFIADKVPAGVLIWCSWNDVDQVQLVYLVASPMWIHRFLFSGTYYGNAE